MANAKQCDRCGKFYIHKIQDLQTIVMCERLTYLGTPITAKVFELCESCIEELKSWIGSENHNNDEIEKKGGNDG